ncbi:MAG: CotH kinase family protein [Saprospiraceae bacterium]|nr:CotH kinase family protein [Saprospiraceae bacterium]
MKFLFPALFIIFSSIIGLANNTVVINAKHYFIDESKMLIVSNADLEVINSTWPAIKTQIIFDTVYQFIIPHHSLIIGKLYEVVNESNQKTFKLYFSELPLIHIRTDEEIVDEPNISGRFEMIENNGQLLESYIGVQYRGGWSQTLPKKSLEIEFLTDETGNETRDVSLLGMHEDDDWNLQAMYNEPLRIRSKTNNELWKKIHTIHYKNKEPDAVNGISMKYVELFINNEYRGVYCLGEKVNRKQLKLKKHNGNIRGELYKGVGWGASTFTSVPLYDNASLDWGGFEYKHPDEEIDWSNLYNFVDFVIRSSSDKFYTEYQNYFHIDNAVDYFIFLNLLRATDNTGKNIYIAKYDTNDKYFYVPWDLDGSFGTIWDGTVDTKTNGLLSNGFYNRLMNDCFNNGFRNKLRSRWQSLRSDLISHDFLLNMFVANQELLIKNGIYERESLTWPDYAVDSEGIDYISDWIKKRLDFLDVKFNETCTPVSVTDESGLINPTIFPNPTNDLIYFDKTHFSDFNVIVSNKLGKVVLHRKITNEDKSLSLKHLENGIYFINVGAEEKNCTFKLVLLK